METIYYNLDARKLTVYGMASGGSAPRPCLCLDRRERPSGTEGVVLDMEAYRRRRAGEEAPSEASQPEAPACAEERPARRANRRTGLLLDLCASLAIVVMAAVVVACFLPFL